MKGFALNFDKNSAMRFIFLSILLLYCFSSFGQPSIEDYFDKNGRVGIKLETGTVIVPGKYDWLSPLFKKKILSEGLSYFRLNKKYGFVNAKGHEIIPAKYHMAWDFSDGWARVQYGPGEDIFLDKQGNEYILNTNYDTAANYFNNGLLAVKKNGKWGFINKKSKLVVSYTYDAVSDFKDSMAAVSLGGVGNHDPSFHINSYKGKWGFIDRNGTLVIPMEYANRKDFKEGLCAVAVHDKGSARVKWGFINKTGNMVITPQYDEVGDGFNEGLAIVQQDAGNTKYKWLYGFINKLGKAITKMEYHYAEPFSNGIALVNVGGQGSVTFTGGEWGFIDKNGKPLFPFIKCARIFGDGGMFERTGSVEVWLKETPSAPGDIYYINIKGQKIK